MSTIYGPCRCIQLVFDLYAGEGNTPHFQQLVMCWENEDWQLGGKRLDLRERWAYYMSYTDFNYTVLPECLKKQGKHLVFQPQNILALCGEFPEYIYFIKSGTVLGQRTYADGNEYKYFRLDSSNGNVGLLELFARKDRYVATIICLTEVEALRIPSADFYEYVMGDVEMLRRCLTLVAKDLYHRSGNDGLYYYMNGTDRVRYYLINYYTTHCLPGQQQLEIRAEYQDIAAEVGISIRTVGRSMQKLRERGESLSDRRHVFLTREKYDLLLSNLKL